MRVVVLGAGATGALFAARLHAAGHAVLLVARPDAARAIAADGVVVTGVRPLVARVAVVPGLAPGTPADAALLAVKAFDVGPGARALARGLAAPAPLLLPQNGLGIRDAAAAGLAEGGWAEPRTRLVRAVHTVPATLLGPGRVAQAGDGGWVLARADPDAPAALATAADLVATMGYPVLRVDALEREVWRKVLVNAAINPVTADHRVPNGRLRDDPWRGQALALLHEARAVAAAEGFPFDADEAERELWRVVAATAANRSSMLQDVDRGRPTEIEAIAGEIVRRAERRGVAVPATRRALDRRRARDPPSRPQPS